MPGSTELVVPYIRERSTWISKIALYLVSEGLPNIRCIAGARIFFTSVSSIRNSSVLN